jgi:hypothetical protein
MQTLKLVVAIATIGTLAACVQTDGQRALVGAAAGAVVADALDESVVAGAALGGLAGATCDDLNVPGCR